MLIDIVSKNGVLLLNVSPMASGKIPENQKKVLISIGDWLKKYGDRLIDEHNFKYRNINFYEVAKATRS
jgi:alpha-L-fucosidase